MKRWLAVALMACVQPTTVEPKEGMRVAFDTNGLTLSSRAATAHIALRCVGREQHCDVPRPRGGATLEGARIAFQRGALREWYVRGPRGVEQGFLVEHSPAGEGALTLEIGVEGLTPVAADRAVLLYNGPIAAMRVDELHAFDATGRELGSALLASNDAIILRVEDRDARYPITIDPLYGAEPIKLLSPVVKANEAFGSSVAMSGDTAIVGDMEEHARVYVRAATGWTLQATLTSGTPEFFGTSVAIRGDTALVGAYLANAGTTNRAGAAYVFTRSGTTWTQQARLVAADPSTDGYFGRKVALDGDLAVAVANNDKSPGSAYIFARSGTTWAQQRKLTGASTAEHFGSSVAVSGSTVIVGSWGAGTGGAAQVLTRAGSTWSEQLLSGSVVGAGFGTSAAIEGDTALIGAAFDPTKGSLFGAVHVYTRTAGTFARTQTLYPSETAVSIQFGAGLALHGDTAAIGAIGATATAVVNSGVAYVFTRAGGTWTEQGKLFAKEGGVNDYFGKTLAVSGDSVLSGVAGARVDGVNLAGAVYTYRMLPTRAAAAACKDNSECTSGYCVDAVCCDRKCDGPCESCTAALKTSGADGVCGATKADTDPRAACTPSTGTCPADGFCDGAGSCRSFAKPGTPCGPTSCTGGSMSARVCKGDTADCVDAVTACGAYACDALTCKTACSTNADCAEKYRCAAGKCEPANSTCSADRARSVNGATGAETACAPFVCDPTSGACFARCTSEAECAGGFRCTATGTCAVLPGPASDSGCAVGGRGSIAALAWLAMCAAMGLLRRRG